MDELIAENLNFGFLSRVVDGQSELYNQSYKTA